MWLLHHHHFTDKEGLSQGQTANRWQDAAKPGILCTARFWSCPAVQWFYPHSLVGLANRLQVLVAEGLISLGDPQCSHWKRGVGLWCGCVPVLVMSCVALRGWVISLTIMCPCSQQGGHQKPAGGVTVLAGGHKALVTMFSIHPFFQYISIMSSPGARVYSECWWYVMGQAGKTLVVLYDTWIPVRRLQGK